MRTGMEQAKVCAFVHRKDAEDARDGRSQRNEADVSNNGAVHEQAPNPAGPSSQPSPSSHSATTVEAGPGRVALGLSGGPSSRTLLHMAKKRLLPPPDYQHRRGKVYEVFAIDVVYVDDGALFGPEDDRVRQVQRIVEEEGGLEAGLHFVPVKLENVFENDNGATCSAEPAGLRQLSPALSTTEKRSALMSLFSSLRPANTPKSMLANARSRIEDMHNLLTMHLLRREALRRGARCLLTGETATRRAIRTIDGVSRGRGHKMPVQEGPARWRGLFTLQPMADATSKEIAYFLRATNLEALDPRDLVAKELLDEVGASSNGSKASIHRLTESLVNLLENNVPGTINTVNRTSTKLVFSDDVASHGYVIDEVRTNGKDAFDRMGPVLPLRYRRRKDSSASTAFSQLSLEGGESTGDDTRTASLIDRGLPDVRGLGLGGLGAKLYSTAKAYPQFDGRTACPLCQMPAQRGLHAWKRGLTVDKRREGLEAASTAAAAVPVSASRQGALGESGMGNAFIDLTAMLCYACSILLDTPENTPADATMMLPAYVLAGAQQRIQEDSEGVSSDAALLSDAGLGVSEARGADGSRAVSAESQASSSMRQQEAHTVHKLDREQMRSRLDGFLLPTDGESASPTPSARPLLAGRSSVRTDW